MKKIPFFGLAREYQHYQEDYQKIFHQVMSHGGVLQGKEIAIFEKDMTDCIGRQFAVAVNSCTDALFYSLAAVGIKPAPASFRPRLP